MGSRFTYYVSALLVRFGHLAERGASSPMDQVLAGRYELEVPLGRGGVGEVWRGSDMATRRPVAVRLVELSQVEDAGLLAETVSGFLREATVISGLRHPNLGGAVDAGRIGNQLFMVMELAPGKSLASMMGERGARGAGLFSVSTVFRIGGQACAGLVAAHAAGIVHRDIKPSNLMVAPSLGVKVIDFGVARLLAGNSPRLAPPEPTVDTVAYMSPERAQGLEVDGRADLYSLGCVLYHLLSGRLPFFSSLPSALRMMLVMDRPVPLSSLRPDLPAEICELVSDLMEKSWDARPASAQQVASRIEAIRGMLGDDAEFEAAPESATANGYLGVGAVTRVEGFARPADRPSGLVQERMAQPSASDTVTAVPRGPAVGQPAAPSTPFQAPYPVVVPAQTGPIRSAPQVAARTGPGIGAGTPVPGWPAGPAPRRRVWPGVLATLVTAAIVAGAGAYYWVHTHQVLRITRVSIAAANPKVGCDGTADLIGTIATNGHGGPIRYQWVLNEVRKPVLTVVDGAGSDTVRVTLPWAFHGKGTGKDVAELDILNPQQGKASITFPYSCPRLWETVT